MVGPGPQGIASAEIESVVNAMVDELGLAQYQNKMAGAYRQVHSCLLTCCCRFSVDTVLYCTVLTLLYSTLPTIYYIYTVLYYLFYTTILGLVTATLHYTTTHTHPVHRET